MAGSAPLQWRIFVDHTAHERNWSCALPAKTKKRAWTPAVRLKEKAMIRITRRRALALGSTTLLLPSALRAQAAWPTGPVTFVVGYAAGGSSDINARELANVMTPVIGQQIIIDNKGGAAGS